MPSPEITLLPQSQQLLGVIIGVFAVILIILLLSAFLSELFGRLT